MDDYDPDTCVTAGHLRACGVELAAHVPDCAWIRRDELYIKWGPPELGPVDTFRLKGIVVFRGAMKWFEVKVEIK